MRSENILVDAMNAQASKRSMDRVGSLPSLRRLPSHATVRSAPPTAATADANSVRKPLFEGHEASTDSTEGGFERRWNDSEMNALEAPIGPACAPASA
jgi:hypothetical protein